jgi:transcriptional regulator with GAF, ATPase, and Fis domain
MKATEANQQIRVLQSANRIAHRLSKAQRVDEAIEELMQEFLDLSVADEGCIQLLRPTSERSRRTLIRRGKTSEGLLKSPLDDLITGWVVSNKQPLLSHDVATLFNFKDRFTEIRSALAAPLTVADAIIGVVILVRSQKRFAADDQQLACALAAEISEFIEEAQLREQLFSENERLRQQVAARFDSHGIIGNSPAMKEVFTILERVVRTDGRVMIQGESGTGKEIIAKFIHYSGPRKNRPFVAVDCGALPANLLESELFGYVRGAFTGADRDRPGLFEEANGGTLFLDEISNMSLDTQAKLLRVLQEEEVRPLGSNQPRKVDVRIIVAASQDLKARLAAGEFRSDLFYRLHVVPVRVPSLRERIEDVPSLASHFLKRFAKQHKKSLSSIATKTIETMERYNWPGNVRELENVIERAVILAEDENTQLLPEHLPYEITFPETSREAFEVPLAGDLTRILADYEREILINVLRHHSWNQSAAADALNISERVMRYKIKRLHLQPPK